MFSLALTNIREYSAYGSKLKKYGIESISVSELGRVEIRLNTFTAYKTGYFITFAAVS